MGIVKSFKTYKALIYLHIYVFVGCTYTSADVYVCVKLTKEKLSLDLPLEDRDELSEL